MHNMTIINMHGDKAALRAVEGVELEVEAGLRGVGRVASLGELSPEVSFKHVVRLLEAIDALLQHDPLASKGVGEVRL